MASRVLGIFDVGEKAARAVARLEEEGFKQDSLSVLFADSDQARAVLAGGHTDAAGGAVLGSVFGGTLMALAAAALAVPGIGVLAAGPLAAALAGAGVGAASGGFLGALAGLGMPRHEAALRSKAIQEGALLLAVDCAPEDAERVRSLLRSSGATDVV